MEIQNELNTPHFIKTVDYEHDNVQNSLQMEGMIKNSLNGREYRSPGRTGYQAKYPAAFGEERGTNLQRNIPQSRYSPSKSNNLSPSKYGSSTKIPIMSNKNLSIDTGSNNQFSYYSNQPQQFSSPSHGYSNQYLPSPYVSAPYHNSNYSSSNQNYNPMQNSFVNQVSSPSNSRSVIQLEKLVSELRLSLQQSLSTQSSLQDQLNKQKSRCFELSEVKRKLEEELSKMEFQLDRITSIDVLGQRQLMVKYQAMVLQNQRVNSQYNDTLEEVRRVKTQCRELMSQNSKIREQCQLLRNSNAELLTQMDSLVHQVNQIKQECNQSALRQKHLHLENQHLIKSQLNGINAHGGNFQGLQQGVTQNNLNSHQGQQIVHSSAHLNSIHTTRTDNYESTRLNRYGNGNNPNQLANSQISQNDHMLKSPQRQITSQAHLSPNYNSIAQSPQQYINYDLQNSKLVDDYNKLQMENDAMKKLYKQFYQQSPKKSHFQSPPSHQKSISQHSEQFQSTNQNFYPNNHADFQQEHHLDNQMLQTYQKNQLYSQIASLRHEVIKELMIKYFHHSLQQAQAKKANVLIVFIKLLTKDIETIEKMVINYLQARDILKKQLNVKRLTQGQEGQPITQFEIQAEGMWVNVKEKLKNELKQHKKPQSGLIDQSQIVTLNINAYFLALFRLLTLVQKYESKMIEGSSKTLAKLKHSALKYVHKIHEETHQLKQNAAKNNIQRINHVSKISLRK